MVDTFKSLLGFNNSSESSSSSEPLLNGQQQQQSSSITFKNSIKAKQQQSSSSSSLLTSSLTSSSSLSINSSCRINQFPNSLSLNQSYDLIDSNQPELQNHYHHSSQNNNNGNGGGGGKITWIMGAFLLINAALGAGLLNYPVAYDRLGGLVYATIIQLFAAILMMTTMLILIYCAQINNEDSYHGVMRTMCGQRVMRISAASIAITCFGICVTFVIIIGDQFDRIFATYIGREFCHYWWANRFFTMTVTAIVFTWPMCYFRRLDFLRHINVLGVIASFYIIFLNIYSYYNHEPDPYHKYQIRTEPQSLLEFVAALPVVFFAYQTHEIVIPVYDTMAEKNIQSFSKSILISMLALLILYCLAGSYGYLTFGSNVAPDIMLMYNANDPIVLAGIIALIVKMITTYPPVVFCGRETIVRIILSRYRRQQHQQQQRSGYECLSDQDENESLLSSRNNYEHRWNIIITTIWNISVLILAIVIPNITIAIGFLGSLASCNVFIFPGIALFALIKRYRQFGYNHQNNHHHNHHNNHGRKQRSKFIETTSAVQYVDDGDDDDDDLIITERQSWFSSKFNIRHNRWLQNLLQIYSIFIIMMGIIMFIIILIQVYHDFQQPFEHGAVCDLLSINQSTAANSTQSANYTQLVNSTQSDRRSMN
ncbi:sodium-coupled neutral amino acid transporter 7-like [Dermatophagoides pteronyssinus]|uniref:sodium-coupled neutral amino acid transporter 7-like n=1 Tax=Dermatophagoides pteronyssinus TaxID=6956 RepID=UPI003F681D94